MINIGVTAEEHITTLAFFHQFSGTVARFHIYPRGVRGRNNFASFPKAFIRKNGVDLVHLTNYTLLNKVNWIVEHEHSYTMLPLTKKRLRLMASPYCRKVTFMSNYAKRTAISFLKKAGHSAREDIISKSAVIYPATYKREQEHDYSESIPLKLCFIGNEFIRKGGLSVWEVFNQLDKQYDIRLTLISNFKQIPRFRIKTLPGYPDFSIFQDRLDTLMASKTDRVRVLGDVPRREVINRYLPEADIFLAPTFSDSFGVSIIEAMAEGLPIIASNINAVPEMIEDEKEGLLIDNNMGLFPMVDKSFHMKYSWRQLRETPFLYYDHVNVQLKEKLVRLIEDRKLRKTLGTNARKQFESRFSMAARNRQYEELYLEAAER